LYGDLLAGFFVEHALTRSVRDCAALLDAISGPVAGEPYVAPAPVRPFAMEVGADPGRLRIGFSDLTPLGDIIDDDCAQAVRRTAGLLESLGHIVEPAQPQYDAQALWQGFTNMMACGAAWAMADWARRLNKTPTADDFEPFVWAFAAHGRTLSGADYLLALQDVQQQVRALSRFYEDYDLFMTPTLGKPPVALGTLVYKDDPFELRRRTAAFSPYCYVSNASGQPSISLPLRSSVAGLPIGIHFTAAYAEEALLLRLSSQLEQAQPWADRRPPVHVT
jgi:amidase